MTDETWHTECFEGYGLRGLSASGHDLARHIGERGAAYGALLRRYRAPDHSRLRLRERVVWRRRAHIHDEPTTHIFLPPPLCARLLGGTEPPPGRIYFMLSLAEKTPAWAVRKVAASLVLAEAGAGGSLASVDRPLVEDMLLRILSWTDCAPWQRAIAPESVPIDPAWEAARPLVAPVLATDRLPGLARKRLEAETDAAAAWTWAGWAWDLANDGEQDDWARAARESAARRFPSTAPPDWARDGAIAGLPPREQARRPAAFDREARIRLKERAVFPDGLEILYRSTSHKHTYPDSPACAMPHLDLTRPGVTEMVEPHWETHGGKSWGQTVEWEGYAIEIVGLEYDKEVRLRVSRPHAQP